MLLTNEGQETLRRLNELIPQCCNVDIVVGYMSSQGFELLERSLTSCLKSGGWVDVTVGQLCEGGDYGKCFRFAQDWPGKANIRVADMPNRLLHGKLYLLQRPLESILVIGSSNLTSGGLQANAEVNVGLPVASRDLKRVEDYITYRRVRAISVEACAGESHLGGMGMSLQSVGSFLDRNCIARLLSFAERVTPCVTEVEVSEWCKQIDKMSATFNNILNVDSFRSGEWTGKRVKTELLMREVWAITEAKHTDLWPRIRKTPGDGIVAKIFDMLVAADQGLSGDEVIRKARIPEVIGKSIASEILHKCRPDRYPIKNKRSHWGMAFILDQWDGPSYPQRMSYSVFQKHVDLIIDELAVWLQERGLTFDPRYN